MTLLNAATSLAYQQHIVLDGVSWEFYEQLLREIGNRAIRVTYDRGRVEIMSPLPKHEKWKSRIGRLIEMMAFEMEIDFEPLGSTTFRRKAKKVGLEPDECYYVEHAADIRGKDRLNLKVDPPPDLAIEVDIFSRSIARQPIYAKLGVPELWRFTGKRFIVLELRADERYHERDTSLAFPFLPMTEFAGFLQRMGTESNLAVLKDFQKWCRRLKR